jgi:G3E family GTPase
MTATVLTPVTVLTGFLGSGKTTLLNKLLRWPALSDTAVIINEFGDVPIDHLLVRESNEQISVLDSGCICCTVQGDLVRTLRDLYFKRSNGEVPPFKRVIIETTGLADPAPILHTLIEMPVVAARYSLSGVVTTVDAEYGSQQLDAQFESVKQAAVADRIVITKADQTDAETVEQLKQRLASLNPSARILTASHGDIDPGLLLDTGLYRVDGKSPDVAKWLGGAAYRPLKQSSSPHDARIRTFSFAYDEPVSWTGLLDAIGMVQALRGDYVLRMKGIVNAEGESHPRVVHAVQHTLYPDATLPAWPDDDHRTRLVFIVRDIEESFLTLTLNSFLRQPEPTQLSAG